MLCALYVCHIKYVYLGNSIYNLSYLNISTNVQPFRCPLLLFRTRNFTSLPYALLRPRIVEHVTPIRWICAKPNHSMLRTLWPTVRCISIRTVVCLSPIPSPSSLVRQFDLPLSLARSVALCLCRTIRLEQYGLCLWLCLCLCPGYGSSSSSGTGTGTGSGTGSASDFGAGSDWVCLGVCLWRCLLPLSIVDCGLDCGRSIVDVDCCCCCFCCRCVLGPPPSGRAARDGHNLN